MIALIACALSVTGAISVQERPDTLSGRVVSDSGAVITGATVTATRAPDRLFLQTTTDSEGHFRIIFAEGTGDYLVHVSATGYRATRIRLTRAAGASFTGITVKLASAVQQLETVKVESERPKPSRTYGFNLGTGEAGTMTDGVNGMFTPDQVGNLSSIGLRAPGMTATGVGFSALGMSSSSNSATLDGMSFAGASIPRDLQARTAVSTSTFDPSRGWFSGAETTIDASPGNLFTNVNSHVTLNMPALQSSQRSANGIDNEFTSIDTGLGATGAFHRDLMMYNLGVQGRVRTVSSSPFDDANLTELRGAGVSPAIASTLRSQLAAFGIPSITRSGMSRSEQSLSFLGRVDRAPFDWVTFKDARTSWSLTGLGNFSSTPPLIMPTSAAGTAETQESLSGGVQLGYSSFLNEKYLLEVRSTISANRISRDPISEMPLGIVRAQSEQETDSLFTAIAFGGTGGRGSSDLTRIWETRARLELWAPRSTKHYLRFTATSRIDALTSSGSDNSLGTFVFNSVEDFQNNRPASFTRTLFEPRQSASVWNGFFSASDSWRVKPNFRLLYGARLEGNHFLDSPRLNEDLLESIGVRNDAVPNTIHVSPRVGFSWTRKSGSDMQQYNTFGNFYRSTARTIRGGIGEFRDILPATLLTGPRSYTGLDDGSIELRCIGTSAPVPDWSSYQSGADAPSECALGSNDQFADSRSRVEFFDRRFTAAKSWRGNLSYTSQYKILFYTVQGTYSLGRSMSELFDRNFSGDVRFISADGRPVYVPPAFIDTRTGSIATQPARIDDSYGSVTANQSTARTRARQITLSVLPVFSGGLSRSFLAGSYAISSTSYTGNGFSSSTFMDPRQAETARSNFDARHQIRLQGGVMSRGFSLTMYGHIQSGLPFTPVIAGDVNGDGRSNDRAFIFTPSMSGDPVAVGMHDLMQGASPRVRKCLERQVGSPARRNSCNGPWTATLNAEMSTYRTLPLLKNRGRLHVVFSNPLGGIDQLMHGSKNLHGWGVVALPDPTLLRVNGFDGQSSFRYEVNPEFGSTRRNRSFNPSPFGITIDLSVDLGKSLPTQQLQRSLRPGRDGHPGPRLTVTDLKRRYARSVPDPYKILIDESDSLLLSREQTEAIEIAHRDYSAGMDSIWTPLAETLAALPERYDAKAALKIQEKAIDDAWEYTRLHVRKYLPTILNPLQLNIAPSIVKSLVKADKAVRFRMYMN